LIFIALSPFLSNVIEPYGFLLGEPFTIEWENNLRIKYLYERDQFFGKI